MRTILFLAGLVLLAGCGGSTESASEPVANAEAPSATADQSSAENGSVVSVPLSDIGADHVDPPVSFSTSPSTGGDHYPVWQNCGFYDVEVIEGAATHTMEHGAVWITYNVDALLDGDLASLEALASANPRLLISPYPQAERLVLSAWGVQQRLAGGPDDSAVAAFIAEWQDNPELAEDGVTCVGALGVTPSNPELFEDGRVIPDEFLG